MSTLYPIGWFIALIVSIGLVYEVVGYSGLTRMFPEGKRWWHLPLQLAALAFFAAVVLAHPFGGAS